MWKGLKRRMTRAWSKDPGIKERTPSMIAKGEDPFLSMGIQYKSFDPENTQVYGMYVKDEAIYDQEEEPSPIKMGDEEESKQIKDPVGQYVPPASLLAARPSLNKANSV